MANPDKLTELRAAIGAATSGVHGNLEHVRGLVRDAVARLLVSFSALQGVVAQERQLLAEVTEKVRASNGGNAFASATIALLNDFVEQVVRVSHDSMRMIERLQSTAEHVDSVVRYANKIDDLARETRFVALNARIETQRAGSAGVTFKVVADEVKRLAGASAELSVRIRAEVSASHQRLYEARQTAEMLAGHDMTSALDSRASIVEYIEKLDQVNSAMASTLHVVDQGVAEAVRALQFEDMVSQLLADSMEKLRRLGSLVADAASCAASGSEVADICQEIRGLSQGASVTQSSLDEGTVELF